MRDANVMNDIKQLVEKDVADLIPRKRERERELDTTWQRLSFFLRAIFSARLKILAEIHVARNVREYACNQRRL